ncbi:hypothetical protein DMH01_15010 [Amycolatopsis sp. WAC 04182]|uniref:hypothetical protein n=1 Tax=Amycolatopsis sp. WAC 04182 TaxID=2203198 RepID=UPI000F77F2FA|nr:hypothetical protein [Amycolatopsis sp. WAC 04182]RSN60607.1 hypothetical protein DMH01_15010 [Amycolatopsis sp. WAC 04182]
MRSGQVRFLSYNLFNYGDDLEQAELAHKVIRQQREDAAKVGDALVVAVQELFAGDRAVGVGGTRWCRRWWPGAGGRSKAGRAGRRLRTLAEATGLRCEYQRNRPAVGVGNQRYHPGLLWSDELSPAGGFAVVAGQALWHAYVQLDLDVGVREPVAHGSFHARPHGLRQRADECEVVVKRVYRLPRRRATLVGLDRNGVPADLPGWPPQASRATSWPEYDHDPYRVRHGEPCRTVDWHPEFTFQCRTWVNADGTRGWEADRTAGRVLCDGGLVDAAAALNVTWAATVGHWPGDQACGPRRLDSVIVTPEVVPALVSCEVISGALAKKASDHLPAIARYAPAAITMSVSERAGG